jgi:signal transduction histidine kinase
MRPLSGVMLAFTCVFAVVSWPLSAGREPAFDTVLYPLMAVVLAAAGTLICARDRRNAIGWVLCAMGVVAALVELTEGYGYHVHYAGAGVVAWISSWASFIGIGANSIVLLLFPTGHVPGPRWRLSIPTAIVATILMTATAAFGHSTDEYFPAGQNPYALDWIGIDIGYVIGQILFLTTLLAAIVSLIVRYRRSVGVERQQLKWVVYAVSLLAVAAPIALVAYFQSVLVQIAIACVVTAIPIAICVAILRYRLYDIDIVINRTVVYGLLTAVLAGGYVAITLTLGTAVGGPHSAWATAVATLALALAFRPLRGRIQHAVDRRFRRSRYDALSRIDSFVEDLRANRAAPETLESVLRQVLGQPTLELEYVLPDGPRPVNEAETADRLHSRVERAGVLLAVVVHDRVDDDPALVSDVLNRAGLAIEIARLRSELAHQLEQVEISRARIVAAGYEERRRLERDLHDGAQQRLVSIGLALRHAQHQLGPSPVSETLDSAVEQITGAIKDLRELANGVRPALLDSGLGFALRELATRTPLPMQVRAGIERFASDLEATAYFVACEAVTNAVKHSAATTVDLQAQVHEGQLVVTVRDNGIGGASAIRGSGLRGLEDRIAAQGGLMHLLSPPGRGTTLTAVFPCG